MKVHFKEEQTFRKSWVMYLILISVAIPIYGMYQQYILGEPFGSKPMSDTGLFLLLFFTLGIVGFLWMIKLTTQIDNFQIKMKFYPLTSKTIQWSEVKTAEVLNYGFVGGWGIRLWTKYGTVYNISGNKGLAIELNNGKKLLIGTKNEAELKSVLANLKDSKKAK